MKFPFRAFLVMRGAFANVGMVAHKLRGKIFRNPLPLIIPGFHEWPPFRRHFVQNLFTGVFIEFLVIIATVLHFGPVVNNQNAVLDLMMRLSTNLSSTGSTRPNQVWLDVDERTYRSKQWGGGEPATIPLEPLAKLIEFALEYEGARYVVVDFTIDGPGNEQQEIFKHRMQTLLDTHPESHLLFMRTIREPLEPAGKNSRSVRPSLLDDLSARYPGRVHAAAPNFLVSEDHVLRHWKLWESACRQVPGGKTGEGRWVILPSPQLIVAALMQQGKSGQQLSPPPWLLTADNKDALNGLPVCAMNGLEDADVLDLAQDSRKADLAAGRWVHDNFGVCYQQDLVTHADCENDFSPIATEGHSRRPQEVGPSMALGNRVYFRISDASSLPPSVQKRPALYVLDSFQGKSVPWQSPGKKDLIAIIGASYKDSRDFHLTPLGEMPGSLVLVNSIDSLCTAGILQSPMSWQKLLVIVTVLVAVSAIFAWLPAFWAAITMMAAIVCLLAPISLSLFMKHGVWLDFAAPLIGIYLHREWEELHERLSSCLPNTTPGES